MSSFKKREQETRVKRTEERLSRYEKHNDKNPSNLLRQSIKREEKVVEHEKERLDRINQEEE